MESQRSIVNGQRSKRQRDKESKRQRVKETKSQRDKESKRLRDKERKGGREEGKVKLGAHLSKTGSAPK